MARHESVFVAVEAVNVEPSVEDGVRAEEEGERRPVDGGGEVRQGLPQLRHPCGWGPLPHEEHQVLEDHALLQRDRARRREVGASIEAAEADVLARVKPGREEEVKSKIDGVTKKLISAGSDCTSHPLGSPRTRPDHKLRQ